MSRKKLFLNLFTLLLLCLTAAVASANDRLIPFQGRLTDGDDKPINAVRDVVFSIYINPTGGEAVWTEEHKSISIISGHINVLLGAKTDLDNPDNKASTADALDFKNPYYLGIKVGFNGQEMIPRHQIVPSFHAKKADHAKGADHALNSDKLNGKLPEYYATAEFADDISADVNDVSTDLNTFKSNLLVDLVPVGTVLIWPAEIKVPNGYLICDGAAYKISEYQKLSDIIKRTYTEVERSDSEFRVPDYRGYFLRGWDNKRGGITAENSEANRDPDKANRTGAHSGITGNKVGTTQDDEVIKHNHDQGAHNLLLRKDNGKENSTIHDERNSGSDEPNLLAAGNRAIAPYGGKETRPKNIYVMYIIKAK